MFDKKKWTAERNAACLREGLCLACKQPASAGKRCCPPCLEMMRNQSKARRLLRKTKGDCLQCGSPVNSSKKLCPTCRKAANTRLNLANQRLREATLAAYGGCCAICGEADFDVLVIDHIYDDGYKERSQTGKVGGQNFYRYLKSLGFPTDRYQLTCANCNMKKEMLRRRRASGSNQEEG